MSVLGASADKLITAALVQALGDRGHHASEYVRWRPETGEWVETTNLYGLDKTVLADLTKPLRESAALLDERLTQAVLVAKSRVKAFGVEPEVLEVPDLGSPDLHRATRFKGLRVVRRQDRDLVVRVLSSPITGRYQDVQIDWKAP